MWAPLSLTLLIMMLNSCQGPINNRQPKMITEAEAIEIAKEAIEGKIQPQTDSPITVQHHEGRYIITFVHITPSDMLGPDYDARVTIDARTGAVLEILGGS